MQGGPLVCAWPTSSPVLADSVSALNESDSKPSVSPKSTPTPPPSSGSIGPMSPTSETSPRSDPFRTPRCGPPAFRARTFPCFSRTPKELRASGLVFGGSWRDCLKVAIQSTSSWKTFQLSFDEGSERFSSIFPRSGILWNGTVYQRPPLAPLTDGIACGLLPTPRASDGDKGIRSAGGAARERARRKNGLDLPTVCGGRPHPEFVEWLMGYPEHHTALDASETPSSRKSRRGLAKESRKSRASHD